jgi:hypothetical protein
MALYTFLPVYKASYDLLLEVFKLAKGFPRDYKYTIGQELKLEAVGLIKDIYRANSTRDKAAHLENAILHLEVCRLLLRLAKDLRLIGLGHFAAAAGLTESVSKQLRGWLKNSK